MPSKTQLIELVLDDGSIGLNKAIMAIAKRLVVELWNYVYILDLVIGFILQNMMR